MVLNEFTFFVLFRFLSIHENSYFFFEQEKKKAKIKQKARRNMLKICVCEHKTKKKYLAAIFYRPFFHNDVCVCVDRL